MKKIDAGEMTIGAAYDSTRKQEKKKKDEEENLRRVDSNSATEKRMPLRRSPVQAKEKLLQVKMLFLKTHPLL